ncbi:MAG: PAS domain S-box protein [Deltaproteobacteria bacterium]|nr:PAS domain S-box protein [Deltaproteobacteria bacterium]
MPKKRTCEKLEQRIEELEKEVFAHRREKEALQESEERFRSLVETISDWIWEVDRNGVYTYVSPKVKNLLGYEPEELICKTVFDLMPPEGAGRLAREFSAIVTSRKPFKALENQSLHKDGRLVIMETSGVPIFDVNGRFCGYRGINHDISERKQLEKEKMKLETQLRQSQKMEAIGTLAGGIAHDFNNILFPIFGYTEMTMEEVPEDSSARSNLEEVFKAANRAKDLVQQILTFSRQNDQELKPLRIQIIIREALKLLRASLPSTIDIRQDIDKDCGPTLADPTQVHQVIMNLCTNAYHAMCEKGGVLEVSLKEVDGDSLASYGEIKPGIYLRLTVSDTGKGMDPEVLERIFNPYFTTKSQGSGTGIGLSVVHGIVKSYSGQITVNSKLGEGSQFHVYLPRIRASSAAPSNLSTRPAPNGTERILLVDDEAQIVRMVQQMLENLGYHVTVRTSSLDAFEAFCTQPDKFDLVITDQTMPNIAGTELAQKLTGIRPDIPIILCTGFSEVITEEEARAMGIRKYVMKPVVRSELARAIRQLLDQEEERRFRR